ncbi:MAG: hypothetical protein R2825_11610 [Saprospiraceae bacterium]
MRKISSVGEPSGLTIPNRFPNELAWRDEKTVRRNPPHLADDALMRLQRLPHRWRTAGGLNIQRRARHDIRPPPRRGRIYDTTWLAADDQDQWQFFYQCLQMGQLFCLAVNGESASFSGSSLPQPMAQRASSLPF